MWLMFLTLFYYVQFDDWFWLGVRTIYLYIIFFGSAFYCFLLFIFFFFKQKTAYGVRISDWSSDVCSSDLDIRGLSVSLPKGADRSFAVEGVSFSVNAGELVCVVGESGSGKSVTAFAVMGLNPPRALKAVAGQVLLQGTDVLKQPAHGLRRLRGEKMAMIFQEPMTALNPVMKVGEQIGEVLQIHSDLGLGKRRARVLETMRDVNLPEPETLYHAYPHQLSGGQRQRIMIAMALTLEPALLIADEPTTALDVTTQAQILALIKDIQRRHGMAVLFITHDFGVVAEIADRVVVMRSGRVVEQGPAAGILSDPKDPYTQMLIAAVPSLTPPRSEEHTSELQSLMRTAYAVFCLTKKKDRVNLIVHMRNMRT